MSKSNEATVAATATTEAAKVNKITADGIKIEAVQKDHKTVSAQIRYLHSKGYDRSTIATFLGKRYQHVRNVLVEDARKAAESKK